jgi:uncharacterized membrane protein YjfL (UPF0719 family)
MACLGLGAIEHLLIWIVVVVAVFAIIRALLGLVTPPPDFALAIAAAITVVRIILWAVITIAIIVVIFILLACVIPIR